MNYEIFKSKFLRKTLAVWCAFATLVTMCGPAWAAVATGDYLGGAANLNGASSGIGNYGTQTDTYAGFTAGGATGVLDWNRLNVPGGATMEFNDGTFYNVVNSAGGMSAIAGAISGTDAANVYIFNPNGILFNAGSSVDVGGVFGALATGVSGTTLADWMANPTAVPAAISAAEMTGDVTVKGGTIKAEQIALAGRNVSTATGTEFVNKTVLAAGDKVTIDGFGGGTVTLTIPDAAWEGDVDMLGRFANNLEAMAAGNVRAANGTLAVDGDLKVNTYGDVDVQPGAFVANNAEVSAKSIAVTARGDVSVVGKTDLKTTAGDLRLTSQKGQAYVLGAVSGDASSIQATGGDLAISADQGIVIGENGALRATKRADSSKGDVTLTSAGKDVLSDDGIQIAGAGAKVSADNGITLTAGDGNVTIKDGAEVAAASEMKTLAITATKGAISEDATSKLTGKGETALAAATTEDITLEGAENDFAGDVSITSAKDVRIVNNADLRIRSAAADSLDLRVADVDTMSVKATGGSATQKITVQRIVAQKSDGSANAVFEQTADGTIEVTGADGIAAATVRQTGAGTIQADKIAGNVEQTGAGAAKLQANTAANGLTITGALTQNDAAATVGADSEAVTVGGLLTQDGGTLNAKTLVLKGGAEQSGGQVVAAALVLDNAAKDVALTSANNDFDAVQGAVDTLKLVDKDDVRLDAVTAGKGLAVQAASVNVAGEVKTTGDTGNVLIEASDAVTPANGEVAVNAAVTAKGNLSVLASGGIAQKANLTAQNGTVDVSAGGELNMPSTAKTEATGNIGYVGNGGTVSGTLKATGAGGKVVVVGVGIGGSGSISGDEIALKVTSLGTATDRVSLDASGIAIEATSGDISVDNDKATEITSVDLAEVKVNRVQSDLSTVEIGTGGDSLGGLKAESGVIDMVNKGTVTVKADVTAGKTLALAATDAGDIIVDTTVSADKNIRLAAAGEMTIDSAVTAGKHLTVIGKSVRQNADLTTADGSVYVEATGGDIVMKAGVRTTAKRSTNPNPHTGEGDVLYKATGDVRAEAGGATIAADPDHHDGAVALASASGNLGENITIEAARSGLSAKGGVKTHLVGDATVALSVESGSIELEHEQGVLTVGASGSGAGADKVVKVLSATATEEVALSTGAGAGAGLEAPGQVRISGHDGSTVVISPNAGVSSRTQGIDITVDRDIVVNGGVAAATDAKLTAGGDLSTPGAGRLVAGRDLLVDVRSSAPQVNIAVGKGVSARSGQRVLSFRTVGGNAYPEVYGNDSKTAVLIDGRVAGGNSPDFSILQGYEQVAALGNVRLTPLFAYMANLNPLGSFVDAQAPGAAFAQANMTSGKGEIVEE